MPWAGIRRAVGARPCPFKTVASKLGLPLDVVCQEVVVIEACSADGRLLVETGVGTVPVVLVGPGWE